MISVYKYIFKVYTTHNKNYEKLENLIYHKNIEQKKKFDIQKYNYIVPPEEKRVES